MSFPEKLPFPALFLVALLALLSFASTARAELSVGAPFPDLEAHDLEGILPAREGRVVLIDFWATWCAPCKASFPHYSALQNELGPRGLVILGVSVDKKAAPYAEFLKREAPTFATVRDGTQKLVAAISPPTMPTCYLLDRRGVLRLIHTGFRGEADVRLLRTEIIKLLDETP